jgi:hypothetical protein
VPALSASYGSSTLDTPAGIALWPSRFPGA